MVLTGVVLLVLLGGWALLVHPDAPEATSWAAACALTAAGVLAGSLLGRADPAVPGLFVLFVAVGTVVVTAPESLSGSPLAPPLGYMNANGALLLAGAAGVVLASGRRSARWQLAAAVVALVLAGVCLVDGAQAAAMGCVVLAAWAPFRDRGPSGQWIVLGVVSVVTPLLLTIGWAAAALPRPQLVVSALSEERFALWQEAWGLLGDHPLSGVGPGRFSLESPTAADPDLAWAHSALLQAGAELGWVGAGLLLLVVVWALVALGRDGLLLGALLLPASVDYVLHFGGVLLLSSLVLGGGIAAAEPTRRPIRPSRRRGAPSGRHARSDGPQRPG
jgi:O-antigen ligase